VSPQLGLAARFAALAGLALGLALAGAAALDRRAMPLLAVAAIALWAVRPRATPAAPGTRAGIPWVVLLAGLAVALGLILGGARLDTTEAGQEGPPRGLAAGFAEIRERAEAALESGISERGASLLRGFVLGEDDEIAEDVRDEFRRAGLGHLLAVSGQNVVLLALLAGPLFALAGMPARSRLLATIALIAVYVPVAGAGPSIQRAGVMGAAALAATLAGRPASRTYALLLAAVATLALDPRAWTDVGWQLSFAAVIAIALGASPLARLLAGADPSRARRALAEGMAMTITATIATAPLAAHHFGTFSLTAIPANLAALPAVAPAMWLGMLAGMLGQLPGAPVEGLSWLAGLCAGFIGAVAHALGPDWAQLDVPAPGATAVAAWWLVFGGAAWTVMRIARRRRGVSAPPAARRRLLAVSAGLLLAAAAALAPGTGGTRPPADLVVTVLDVGQGDSILLRPAGGAPVLVDTGPAGAGAVERLRDLGVVRLGALIVSHDQADHDGALAEVLSGVETDRLVHGPGPLPRPCRSVTCPEAVRVAAGSVISSGRLRLRVLWPPRGLVSEDPNAAALVLLASFGRFDALLTGDAEAELAAFAAPEVEVLKVAHHGSADGGLDRLLSTASPRAAVISVGAGNPYGHPAPDTLASLADHEVPVLRTDEAGEVEIRVSGNGWTVE
jgi:competence protein ComEC